MSCDRHLLPVCSLLSLVFPKPVQHPTPPLNPPPLFILCRPLSSSQHFPLEVKLKKILPQGNESLCPAVASLPIYFRRVTLQRQHPPFLFCRLCVLFSDLQSPPFVFFSCSGPSARMKVRVAQKKKKKKHSALGLHCLFHVRTSGDIKGLLRGLSLCISSAPTVCARDPGMCSVFHSISPRLKALAGREAVRPHLPAVLLRTYVACLETATTPTTPLVVD